MDFSNMEGIVMKVHKDTLRNLRMKMGFSQEALANESRVSKKTIARIEGGKGGETRGSTVQELARALRIKPEVLAEAPESETVREQELQKHGLRPVKLVLDGETILAFGLVAEQYGVETRQIMKAAPMLFTLLAEMSLADRCHRAKAAKTALEAFEPTMVEFYTNTDEHLEAHISEYADVTSFDIGMTDFLNNLDSNYDRRGLFSKNRRWDGMFEDYFERNPFSDFLKQLAKDLGRDNDAINPKEVFFDPDGFLNCASLFEKYRKSLTGGSARADYALSHGYTRIRQIPKELRGEDEDVTSRRVKWLEAKAPDEDWDEYENLMDSLVL